jgi:hypothetical protein
VRRPNARQLVSVARIRSNLYVAQVNHVEKRCRSIAATTTAIRTMLEKVSKHGDEIEFTNILFMSIDEATHAVEIVLKRYGQ